MAYLHIEVKKLQKHIPNIINYQSIFLIQVPRMPAATATNQSGIRKNVTEETLEWDDRMVLASYS